MSDAERGALPDTEIILPFATLARPTGERKRTGLTGSLLPEPVEPPPPPTRIVQLPDGDAEGARGEPPEPKRHRTASPPRPKTIPSPSTTPPESPMPAPDVTDLTPDGAARLQAELDELIRVRRPEVIRRIATAREHGDLKENAEYHSAREEGGFLEGRIQALEARLRSATIVEAPAAGSKVGLGSIVTVESDGEEERLTIVGSAESDPDRRPDLIGLAGGPGVARARAGRRRGHHDPGGRSPIPGGGRRLTVGGAVRPTHRRDVRPQDFGVSTSLCSTA